jgi:hypothetical protein
MALFWSFLVAIVSHWYAAATGGLFVLSQLLRWLWPGGKKRLDGLWPEDRRRPVEVLALAGLLAFASFEVFKDEHTARGKAEASAASGWWWANYWERLASRPMPQAPAVINAPPKEPKHLVHSLEAGGANLAIWGNQENGQHASAGADIRSWILGQFYLDLTNHGEDLLRWRMVRMTISSENRVLYNKSNGTPELLPAMKAFRIIQDFGNNYSFSFDTTKVRLSYDLEYDTVPSTGLRRTGKTIDYTVDWQSPDGYKVKNPILKQAKLVEREN